MIRRRGPEGNFEEYVPNRCKACRETGMIHCCDPLNCGGPWDTRLVNEAQETTMDELTKLREAVGMAYGYLWCVNNEPGTPAALYPLERAAYEARKLLRDTMTHEQRGVFINRVLPIVRGEAPCG